jgi:inosine-uridine nucleoside N-ribohydrolase
MVHHGVTPDPGKFIQQVTEACDAQSRPLFPRTTTSLTAYPPSVTMLRQWLSEAKDASVTIVTIGFSTNMARLLDSPLDSSSNLDGLSLFQRKVNRVVMMAANFSQAAQTHLTREYAEYNILMDIPSARNFIARCPSPIFFSGFEIGLRIPYPASSIERDFTWARRHPVVEGYRLYQAMPYDRPTWDLTAVLFAVRPNESYFGLSPTGQAIVQDNGAVRFNTSPTGRHQYLTVNDEQISRIAATQIELAGRPIHAVPDLAPRHAPKSATSEAR